MADVEKLNINNTDYDIADAVAREKIQDIEAARFPNAIIIGEPTITQGQISGFSANNYLQFPFLVDLANKRFTIKFCFTTGDDVTTQQNILDSEFGLALAIANGKGLMAISHNGTSWAGAVVGTMTINPNTTYYAELSWNRINYQTKLSTDGSTYTADMNFGSTQAPYPRTMFIGGCSGSAIGHAPHPFGGTINFNKCYLFIEDIEVWQGMDDVGLATRADVSLDNLDARGEARFAAKQDVLTAGDNITIEDGVISATSSVPEGVMINKATGTKSIIEDNSGISSYPTTTQNYSTIIGHGTYMYNGYNYGTLYGYAAYSTGNNATSIGSSAGGATCGTSVGSYAYSTSYATAVGYSARASNSYSVAIGYGSSITGGSYGVAIGYSAQSANTCTTAIGGTSRAGGYYSAAFGYGAQANASSSIQLGNGTNSYWGSLQFRDYQLVDSEGKIPIDRLPKEALAGGDTVVNLYELPEDDNKHVVYQYTGATNPLFTTNYFYRSEVRYTYPLVACSWVTGGDYVPNREDVTIDQELFFKQLVRVTRQRKAAGDIDQGILGGGSSEMSMYFYYNGTDQEWHIEFGDDSIEGHHTPDNVEGITDLTQWGIYLNNVVTLPGTGEEEEMFDVRYQAPLYFDSYDWGSDSFTVDYEQLLSGLMDGDWGIPSATPSYYGMYVVDVDGTQVYIPLLTKAYYDGEEEMRFRFEWNPDIEDGGAWEEYINGTYTNYNWVPADLEDTFGIHVNNGDESDVEYIEFKLRPARQLYWEYCNPVDTSLFMMKDPAETDNYDSTKNQVLCHSANGTEIKWKDDFADSWDNNIVELTGTTNLNNLRTPGWYKISGAVTGVPTNFYKDGPILVRVISNGKTGSSERVSQRIYNNTYPLHSVSGVNFGINETATWERIYYGFWLNWHHYLSERSGASIAGFNPTKQQKLTHSFGSTASESHSYFQWVDDDGGSGGTTDYEDMDNKPQINGTELSGNVSLEDIGAASESNLDDTNGRVSDLETAVGTMKFWHGTIAEYNNVSVKDANTLYIIKG